jgi:hypothetical protein
MVQKLIVMMEPRAASGTRDGTEGIFPMSTRAAALFLIKEFKEVLPPTIFFAVGFNFVVFTVNLIILDYGVRFSSVILATAAALVVGKAVLLANHLPFLRRLDTAPIIQPVLFKSIIYFGIVFFARVLESLVKYLLHGGTLGGIPHYIVANFTWSRFLAIQLWILVLFLIYAFITELNVLFGNGELARIMFTRRSTELKLTRRQRVRTLVRLDRLMDAHTADELRDGTTAAHAEMLSLLRGLAKAAPPRQSSPKG